jgi:hypothetical protein
MPPSAAKSLCNPRAVNIGMAGSSPRTPDVCWGICAPDVLQCWTYGRAMDERPRIGTAELARGIVREPSTRLAMLRPLAIGHGRPEGAAQLGAPPADAHRGVQ